MTVQKGTQVVKIISGDICRNLKTLLQSNHNFQNQQERKSKTHTIQMFTEHLLNVLVMKQDTKTPPYELTL